MMLSGSCVGVKKMSIYSSLLLIIGYDLALPLLDNAVITLHSFIVTNRFNSFVLSLNVQLCYSCVYRSCSDTNHTLPLHLIEALIQIMNHLKGTKRHLRSADRVL